MRVVYHDYGGSHSTATAVAVHLGILPPDKIPSAEDLVKKVPLFDNLTAPDHGKLFYMGEDSTGNSIYLLPRRNQAHLVINAIKSTAVCLGKDLENWMFVDTIPTVNLWMRIGGYLSRRQGLVWLGRPIVIFGTRRAFPAISRLVQKTKTTLRKESRFETDR